MDKKEKNAAAKGRGTIVDFFVNWIKFKFVNCKIGNMGKLLMYFVFFRFEEIFYAHC
jgi:hypothetical protein